MIDKRHPAVVKIDSKIKEMYDGGRVTSISNEEMEILARKYLPEYFVSEFEILKTKAEQLVASLAEELVENNDIKSMDPNRQVPVLQQALDTNPFIQFMYVTNLEGRKITPNITHIADRAKYANALLDEDLSNRDWFINPIKTGKVYVSDFYTSRFTGALCITVSAPIRNETDEIQGVLGMDIRFKDLAKMEMDGEI